MMGDKEPMGPAVARGNMIHSKAENYLKGIIHGIPRELVKLHGHYVQLAKAKPIVEEFWYVNEDWEPVEKKSEAWCVMKMDAAIAPCESTDDKLFVQDLKTGKEYGSHLDQASLYASIGATRYKKARRNGVDVEFWYADLGFSQPYDFSPRRIVRDTGLWRERGEDMMRAIATLDKPNSDASKVFLPTPSIEACKWCFLRTDKGGTCDAWKTNRMN